MGQPAFGSILQIVGLSLAGVLILSRSIFALEFHAATEEPRRVAFVSDAPIESFEGVTESIDGFLVLSNDTLTPRMDLSESRFYFEVDLNSLDTGLGLRNRHMRENYLHTEAYPYAEYGGTIDSITAVSDTVLFAYTRGELTIHGIMQEREIVVAVTVRNGRYHVASRFPVALPDHGIEIPKLMFLKINEVVELHLTFSLRLSDPVGQEE